MTYVYIATQGGVFAGVFAGEYEAKGFLEREEALSGERGARVVEEYENNPDSGLYLYCKGWTLNPKGKWVRK